MNGEKELEKEIKDLKKVLSDTEKDLIDYMLSLIHIQMCIRDRYQDRQLTFGGLIMSKKDKILIFCTIINTVVAVIKLFI